MTTLYPLLHPVVRAGDFIAGLENLVEDLIYTVFKSWKQYGNLCCGSRVWVLFRYPAGVLAVIVTNLSPGLSGFHKYLLFVTWTLEMRSCHFSAGIWRRSPQPTLFGTYKCHIHLVTLTYNTTTGSYNTTDSCRICFTSCEIYLTVVGFVLC